MLTSDSASRSRQLRADLDEDALAKLALARRNLVTPVLYEEAIRRHEGRLARSGPLVVRTGQHTGRSPNDKFLVREPSTEGRIWWGDVNRPIDEASFETLRRRLFVYLQGKDLFVQDCAVGADPDHRLAVRVLTETAWHSLFAHNMFIRLSDEVSVESPRFTVIHAPGFHANPAIDGTRSESFVIIHFARRLVLIGGTQYAGEIKKAMFTVMNFVLPQRGVLPLHSSVNVGNGGDTAIFFGLSGTGKTSLSTDSSRMLVGDDEHGWSDRGTFNFEGGCYAKVIRLSTSAEPEIYATTRRFGTILENVAMDARTRELDLDDDSLTENARAAYPLDFIEHARHDGMAGHPSAIIMLTADAFGVLPPISKLTTAQAMFQFISGYTAKLAGTERGVTEPRAVFSACFGAPFLPLPPPVYARLLGERLQRHRAAAWLVNTGWTGGPYGTGKRIAIAHTRAMIRAALDGSLDQVAFRRDPTFGVDVPTACKDVPAELLDPRRTSSDPAAYDARARHLARMFVENFEPFAPEMPADVRAAVPRP